jgi:hypothetical protein
MKLGKIAFAFVLFATLAPQASAYLWTVSGDSPVYPAMPKALPSIAALDYGHCSGGFHRDNCVYYETAPFSTYGNNNRFFRNSYQQSLPPGLGLVGWRYENGRYVRDVYEGYGNSFCRGRYC